MTIELEQKVNDANSDNLIVLDACRYDYFRKVSNVYPGIEGELSKAKSPGSWTIGTVSHFNEVPATVYSGHRLINGIEKPIGSQRLTNIDDDVKVYTRFDKVVDLWDELWCTEYGTVKAEVLREVPYFVVGSEPPRIDDMSDPEYIRFCYEEILGREPDKEGIENYAERLEDADFRRPDLIRTLINSDESKQKRIKTKMESLGYV